MIFDPGVHVVTLSVQIKTLLFFLAKICSISSVVLYAQEFVVETLYNFAVKIFAYIMHRVYVYFMYMIY